jgi:hypothetical protein
MSGLDVVVVAFFIAGAVELAVVDTVEEVSVDVLTRAVLSSTCAAGSEVSGFFMLAKKTITAMIATIITTIMVFFIYLYDVKLNCFFISIPLLCSRSDFFPFTPYFLLYCVADTNSLTNYFHFFLSWPRICLQMEQRRRAL